MEIAWKKSCWGQIKILLKIIALVTLSEDACPLERFFNSQNEHFLQYFELAVQKYCLNCLLYRSNLTCDVSSTL